MNVDTVAYRIQPNSKVDLKTIATAISPDPGLTKRQLKKELADLVQEFSDLQELLFAENKQSLLIVFQGMDAAGKDSTIKKVASGVNPQGLRVYNFNAPTATELARSYLHRHWVTAPERSYISIFNRSHYEEVLVVRVHPELLALRKLADSNVGEDFWMKRFADIRAFETHLERNGTRIVKFFLHLSNDEQKVRLIKRMSNPEKVWKFDPTDIRERVFWDEYQTAYEDAIGMTSTAEAPWYVIPADDKAIMRVIVATIIVNNLKEMEPSVPELSDDQAKVISYYRTLS